MSQIAKKLKALLPQASEQAQEVRAAISDLDARIAALNNERDALSSRRVTRDDVVDTICADIDRLADDFRDRMADQIKTTKNGHTRKPVVLDVNWVGEMRASKLSRVFGGLLGIEPNYGPMLELRQDATLFLFRPELKRAAAEVVDAANLDYTGAAPLAESAARMQAIGVEIGALETEKCELVELAKSHGLRINGDPQPVARVAAGAFDAATHPYVYQRKRANDSTPTRGANIIRTHKEGGADSYIFETDMPDHLRALIQ